MLKKFIEDIEHHSSQVANMKDGLHCTKQRQRYSTRQVL